MAETTPDNDRAILGNALIIMFVDADERGDLHHKKIAENAIAAFSRLNVESLALQLVAYDLTAPTKYMRFPGFEEWPEPQPITDTQKTGERFLVWNDSEYPDTRGWFTAFYDGKIDGWLTGALGGYTELDRVVAVYLPLPPGRETVRAAGVITSAAQSSDESASRAGSSGPARPA